MSKTDTITIETPEGRIRFESRGGKGARELQHIAADLLAYATNYEPHVLLAGITAAELVRLARFVSSNVTTAS